MLIMISSDDDDDDACWLLHRLRYVIKFVIGAIQAPPSVLGASLFSLHAWKLSLGLF